MKKSIILKTMICLFTINLTAETKTQPPMAVEINSESDRSQEKEKSFGDKVRIAVKKRFKKSPFYYAMTFSFLLSKPHITINCTPENKTYDKRQLTHNIQVKGVTGYFFQTLLGMVFLYDVVEIIGECL
jgi:hypothetical protein